MRAIGVHLLFCCLVFWMVLTPPGLCPCWLLQDFMHPHARPEDASSPHPHDDLGQDQNSEAAPQVSLPALVSTALLSLAAAAGLWLRVTTWKSRARSNANAAW